MATASLSPRPRPSAPRPREVERHIARTLSRLTDSALLELLETLRTLQRRAAP